MSRTCQLNETIAMPRGSLLRIEDGRELVLTVEAGSLWLTQDGDRCDWNLSAGASFCLDRDGVALAQATRRTFVTLTAASPAARVRRIALKP